jgi:primosomal protein N' (replication factor Y)
MGLFLDEFKVGIAQTYKGLFYLSTLLFNAAQAARFQLLSANYPSRKFLFHKDDISESTHGKEEALADFVDVAVPLYVPGTYTYRLVTGTSDSVSVGQRVLVQFGRKKVYAAIVTRLHHEAPRAYKAKYVLDILDYSPVISLKQLELWNWMATYYMCHLGEVMAAAMPAGFRISSETMISRFESATEMNLDTRGHLVMSALDMREEMSMDDLSELLGSPGIAYKTIQNLIGKRAIALREQVKERYKPIYQTYILLHPDYEEEQAMQGLFNQLEKRAHQQSAILLRYVELSKYGSEAPIPVLKKTLIEQSGAKPASLKALIDKGVFYTLDEEVGRIKDHRLSEEMSLTLSEDQLKAKMEVTEAFSLKNHVLLHGVTSSGKTEVYVELIKDLLARGEQVLYLVPEIALTTQLITRLQAHFGEKVAVYHSRHTQNERYEIWQNLLDPGIHDHRIIIGARSAVFLPFKNLGLIIVDEEHDGSFKQYDPAPRYQARDTAFMLGRIHQAKVLLGSATPSVESIQMCKQGSMVKVDMLKRYGGIQLPEILVADIKKETRRKTMSSHFSSLLMQHMTAALEAGKQVILFQNRRGYNPLWQCENCGWNPECQRCDVSLTYHMKVHKLKCHYCGAVHEPPIHCPACGSKKLKMIGFGTEKIEDELALLLPDVRIQRMDLDTTRGKHAHARIIMDFEQRKTDVLVGTQMVTKGLDFDNVAVVGVLNADLMINRTDFRAFERAYQMITQVAGRAGRDAKGERGKVIIQTMQPEHWVVRNVVDQSYEKLISQELLERKNFGYPPFVRMLTITVSHKKQELVDHASNELAQRLTGFLGSRLLGPQYPYISRIKDRYRMEMIIKIEKEASITKVKEKIQMTIERMKSEKHFKSLRISIDVDPQ